LIQVFLIMCFHFLQGNHYFLVNATLVIFLFSPKVLPPFISTPIQQSNFSWRIKSCNARTNGRFLAFKAGSSWGQTCLAFESTEKWIFFSANDDAKVWRRENERER
jgi:hypothetical protein